MEDDDSRVKIVKTATDDLKGIWRLWRDGTERHRRGQRIRLPPDDTFSSPVEEGSDAASTSTSTPRIYEDAVDRSVSFTGRDAAFFRPPQGRDPRGDRASPAGFAPRPQSPRRGLRDGDDRPLLRRTGAEAPRRRHLRGDARQGQRKVPKAEFSWYDGEKLPFADETFDVVVAICVLHHVPVPKRFKVVNEMVRVARPEGVVAVFEHNPYNPLTRHAVNTCALDQDAVLLSSRETAELLRTRPMWSLSPPFPVLPAGRRHRLLARPAPPGVPLGGQYVAWVQRPPASS